MKRKYLALLVAVMLMLASLAACSTATPTPTSAPTEAAKPTEQATVAPTEAQTDTATVAPPKDSPDSPYGKYAETVTITTGRQDVTNAGFPEGDTIDNNAWLKYIKDKGNIDVKFDWIAANADMLNQKIALMLAGGQMPDTLYVDRKTFVQLKEAGMIADLTSIYEKTISPEIKDYYNSFNGRNLKDATYDGKLLGFPVCNIGGQQDMLWVRQDWLDKLGLQMPKTLDDVKKVAKAFIEKDPDGNGKADTLGLTCSPSVGGNYNDVHNMNVIFGLYGAYPRQWIKDTSGNIIYGSTAPEMKPALAELASMYKDGLIDKQFAIRGDDTNAQVANGKVGMVFGPWWIPYWPLADSVKNDPKANWKPTLAPADANGDIHLASQDPAGMYVVVSAACKNPEAVAKILNFEYAALKLFDRDAVKTVPYFDTNGSCKVSWGTIPIGVQLGPEDDVNRFYKQLKAAVDAKDPSKLTTLWYTPTYDNVMKNQANPGVDANVWSDAVARIDGQALAYDSHVKLVNPAFFGTTPTMETKWATLKKMEDEMMLKIVMGEQPVDNFDKFVSDWNGLGGSQIAGEVKQAITAH